MNNYLIFVLEVRSNLFSPFYYNESLMSPTNAIVKGSMMWNLWHGCHKLSPGCKHCYVYRGDAKRDIDSSVVTQTKNFDLPLRKKRNGDYKVLREHWYTPALLPTFLLKMPTRGVRKLGK
jgi:hypothetical protein